MKTVRFCISCLLALLCLVSCTEDARISAKLHGDWEGNFGMYYFAKINGVDRRFSSYFTQIRFEKSAFYDSGKGYQIDFYNDGPYKFMSYRFNWRVSDTRIILEYPANPEWNTIIREYELDSRGRYFYGYFGDSNERFTLTKVDNADWGQYMKGDFYYESNPGYGPRFINPASADSLDNYCLPSPSEIHIGCNQ